MTRKRRLLNKTIRQTSAPERQLPDCPYVCRPNPNPPRRQNAELARLRQDCVRLGRELTERTDALRADEERRKSLEAKMAAAQQELAQAQVRNTELLS